MYSVSSHLQRVIAADCSFQGDNVWLHIRSKLGAENDGKMMTTHMLQSCKDFCLAFTRLDLRVGRRDNPDVLAERYQLLRLAELGQPFITPVHRCLLLGRSHVDQLAGKLLSVAHPVGHVDSAIGAEAQTARGDDQLLTEKLASAN